MFIRAILGAALAAALLFVWGFVYWTVLPFALRVMQAVESEQQLAEAMLANLPGSGMFVIPAEQSKEPAAVEDYQNRLKAGPVAVVAYRRTGVEMSAKFFGFGYLQMFLSALAAALVLAACDVAFYPGRVMIVFWIGIFAALWANLSDVAWFHYPLNYFWLKLGYTIPAAIIMGIVMAAFVRPPVVERS